MRFADDNSDDDTGNEERLGYAAKIYAADNLCQLGARCPTS